MERSGSGRADFDDVVWLRVRFGARGSGSRRFGARARARVPPARARNEQREEHEAIAQCTRGNHSNVERCDHCAISLHRRGWRGFGMRSC